MLTKLGKIRACAALVTGVVVSVFTVKVAAKEMNIGKDVQDFKEAIKKDDAYFDDDDDETEDDDPVDGDDTILNMMNVQNSAQAADPMQ